MRKPIIQCVNTANSNNLKFTYKYIRNGYVLGDIPIPFYTDLNQKEFDNYLNGKYSMNDIQNYELYGTFQKSPKIFLVKC